MYQVGIDVGGTNIKIGLIDTELQIIRKTSIPFPRLNGEEVAIILTRAVRGLLDECGLTEEQVHHIGVVVPGSIDPTGGVIIDAHNLGFHQVPFREFLQKQFASTPIYLANDADGAALAELGCGAFVEHKTAVLLTLGTGVGGGVILGGKLFSGGCRRGTELGHMQIVAGGELCTCGVRGCIEAYCSATALIRDAIRAMKNHPDSKLALASKGSLEEIDAKFIIDCAKDGDPVAVTIFDNYVNHLADACVSIIHILDPEVIAIGGGVSYTGDFLFDSLKKKVSDKCFFSSHGKIVPAVMRNDAGIIGAAMLGQ